MSKVVVSFSDAEVNELIHLAKKRHNAKDSSFRHKHCLVKNAKSTAVPHEIGILGEEAYGRYVGLDIDREIYDVRDDGSDFEGIEVKTVTYFGSGEPELKVPVKDWDGKHKDIKKFVLARISLKDYKRVELLGEITRDQFNKLKKEKVYGPNKPLNYIVPASALETIASAKDNFGF